MTPSINPSQRTQLPRLHVDARSSSPDSSRDSELLSEFVRVDRIQSHGSNPMKISRKPVPVTTTTRQEDHCCSDNGTEAKTPCLKTVSTSAESRVHWATPTAATLLFVLGLGVAVGHCIYFRKIKDQPVTNQTWTQRYSLVLAFFFKSTLAAAVSISLAQHVWLSLRRSREGTTVAAVDAMFLAGSSLLNFLSLPLWRSAVSVGLMAACIWFMPLTAIVAPTALTIGNAVTNSTDEACTVPVVNFGVARNSTVTTQSRALFVTDNSDLYTHPSASSLRLAASVVQGGHQESWSSPCGPNCTYDVQFFGPAWQCMQVDDVDDSRAPWKAEYGGSFWYWGEYGDGSNITVTSNNSDNLLYSPVYYAGLNGSTNQFWAAFASGFARGLDPSEGRLGSSLRDILEVQAYSCQISNSSYHVRVTFENGQQTNIIRSSVPSSTFDIAPEGWNGQGTYENQTTNFTEYVPLPLQDLIGLYTPMIKSISGYIYRDPRYELVANSSLGTIPGLINNLPIYVAYASETPYLPLSNLGPLLEELSHNLTISLMADPSLLVTDNMTVSCYHSRTEAVWRVDWVPILVAYATGLGVTLICLVIGTYALVANGAAYDTSFSTTLRTTRNSELDALCEPGDVGSLPLTKKAKQQRLCFATRTSSDATDERTPRPRIGFIIED